MSITVLVTTYHRPKDLVRCLEALKKQSRAPDEVSVVVRYGDIESCSLLENTDLGPLMLRTVSVKAPGAIAAMNAGLSEAQGDIISITDDDSAPRSDWLARIEAHFRDDQMVGGVGGRDWVYEDGTVEDGAREVVGKVQWFGRTIGNHHLGVGGPREVDVLKGVNMSFRRVAIQGLRFDDRLRGLGAQVHCELPFGLTLKRLGWKIIYDSAISVDHYPGKRFAGSADERFNVQAVPDAVHNETLALLEHLSPVRRIVFMVWAVVVGTRYAPGLVQWLRFLPREGRLSGERLRATLRGRIEGWRTWRHSRA